MENEVIILNIEYKIPCVIYPVFLRYLRNLRYHHVIYNDNLHTYQLQEILHLFFSNWSFQIDDLFRYENQKCLFFFGMKTHSYFQFHELYDGVLIVFYFH